MAAPYIRGKHCVTFTKYSHLSTVPILADACSITVTTGATAHGTNILIKQGSRARGVPMNCMRPIKEYIHPPVLGQRKPGPEKLGKYQLYSSNLLPSPSKKLPRILRGKMGKGKYRLVGFNTSGVKVGHKLC